MRQYAVASRSPRHTASPFGPCLYGTTSYLKTFRALSYDRLQKALFHLFGLRISQGELTSMLRRAEARFDAGRDAALSALRRATSLLHHLDPAMLRTAFFALRRDAAVGVDRLTWGAFEADLDRRIDDLHRRVQRGAYRAQLARRRFIPKPDGRQRPLAIAALEDKIVQRATVAVLNGIYEGDFLGFSYGFRPGRGHHDALDALCVGISGTKVNHILDADIRSFFDDVSQEGLMKFLNHRIADPRTIRLIQRWLKAGILEDRKVEVSDRGQRDGCPLNNAKDERSMNLCFSGSLAHASADVQRPSPWRDGGGTIP